MRDIILRKIVIIMTGIVIVGLLFGSIACRSESQSESSSTVCVFEQTRKDFIAYCQQQGLDMSNPSMDFEDMYVITLSNGSTLRIEDTTAPYDGFDHIVISASDRSLDHSPAAHKPILDTWRLLEPDIVPLFESLEASTDSQKPTSELRPHKNTSFSYGIAKNNKFFAERSKE